MSKDVEIIDVETTETNNELVVTGMVPGQITTNFKKFKAFLLQELEEYRTMEVTDANLSQRKKDLKRLNATVTAIDNRRKEVKREFVAPLNEYEDECKEAMAIVKDVSLSLKKDIEVFNDKVRESNRKYYSDTYSELIGALEVPDQYKHRVDAPSFLNNLTCKKKDIKDYLERQASEIKLAYQKVKNNEDFVKNTVVSVSDLVGIAVPITVQDIEPYIDSYETMDPNHISNVITKMAKQRKDAEIAAIEREKERIRLEDERKAEEARLRQEEEERKAEEAQRLAEEAEASANQAEEYAQEAKDVEMEAFKESVHTKDIEEFVPDMNVWEDEDPVKQESLPVWKVIVRAAFVDESPEEVRQLLEQDGFTVISVEREVDC